jgi:hypothetical protein
MLNIRVSILTPLSHRLGFVRRYYGGEGANQRPIGIASLMEESQGVYWPALFFSMG